MVASPYEMLDDLAVDWQELQQAKEEGAKERVEALKTFISRLSSELEQMGFQEEVRRVLRTESTSNTKGAI